MFFLPFFGQRGEDMVYMVSLLNLSDTEAYIRIPYMVLISLTVVFGVAIITFQSFQNRLWLKSKLVVSLVLSALGVTFL